MEPENPYQPPRPEILSSSLPPAPQMKRPGSHKVLIVLLGLTVALRTHLYTKMPPSDVLVTVEMFFPYVPFLALLFFRKAQWTYYITAVSLLLLFGPGAWTSARMAAAMYSQGAGMFIPQLLGSLIGIYLMGLLGWKYICGRASREYYGFDEQRKQ